MRDEPSEDRLQLEVPATPGLLSTIRLFVASAARLVGLDEDAINDLKLAVSEAASAIVAGGRQARLTVAVTIDSSALSVEVSPLVPEDLTSDHLHPGDIVLALFPDATLDAERSALLIPVGSRSE